MQSVPTYGKIVL